MLGIPAPTHQLESNMSIKEANKELNKRKTKYLGVKTKVECEQETKAMDKLDLHVYHQIPTDFVTLPNCIPLYVVSKTPLDAGGIYMGRRTKSEVDKHRHRVGSVSLYHAIPKQIRMVRDIPDCIPLVMAVSRMTVDEELTVKDDK